MSLNLFQPITVGRMNLKHRVAMAPLTRSRASVDHVVGEAVKEHYAMRAAVPGTFLISEATFVTPRDMAVPFWRQPPALYNNAQAAGWKKVVDAVHAHGSYIYCQFAAPGRLNSPEILESINPAFPYISASATPVPGWSKAPEMISRGDIKNYVGYFADAAGRAVYDAGFDGVEIAATYFIEEFLKSVLNDRNDEYGFQSPENAARFLMEILDAVVKRVGEDRVGVKLNPWTRMSVFDPDIKQADPKPVYSYIVKEINRRWPKFAFIQAVESRMIGDVEAVPGEGEVNDFLRELWIDKPFFVDGGYSRTSAVKTTQANDRDVVIFGRWYTSNPDLPIRLLHSIPLTQYDRPTFYTDGGVEGYNDFKFAEESKRILEEQGVDVSDL